MYHPVGETHGNQTLAEERWLLVEGRYADVWLPGVWFGFALDMVVIISFFAFKKQRRFPNCILGLMCCVDWLHFLRELIKGSPIPSVNEQFYWSQTLRNCATIYLWVAWVEASQYVLAISLSVVVYLTVVQKEELSYKSSKRIFWTVVTVFIVYPIVYTCMLGAVTASQGYKAVGASCAPLSYAPSVIGICQCFLAVIIISVLICISLKYPIYTVIPDDYASPSEEIYIWGVIKNIRHMASSSQHRKAWITIRFVLIIFLQAAPRVLYNVYYLMLTPVGKYLTPKQLDNFAWAPLATVLGCYYLNAVVVVWSNKSLHKWIVRHKWFVGKYVTFSATSSGSSAPQQVIAREKDKSFLTDSNIEMSKIQIQSDDSV